MSANSDTTGSEQVDNEFQSQLQQVTEEDPARKAISKALEQIYKNLETTMNKWDTLGGRWGSILFEELARSCKELEEVAELIKGRLDSAESM